MSSDLWWGAVISFPVSIAGSLAAPTIQQWVINRWRTSLETKREKLKNEYEAVLYYALHTDMMLGKLVVSAINLISLVFFMILVGATAATLGVSLGVVLDHVIKSTTHREYRPHVLVFLDGVLIAIAASVVVQVFRYATRSIKLFYNIRNFRGFAGGIPEDIRDIKREELVSHARFDRAIPGFNSAKKHLISIENMKAPDGGKLGGNESQK